MRQRRNVRPVTLSVGAGGDPVPYLPTPPTPPSTPPLSTTRPLRSASPMMMTSSSPPLPGADVGAGFRPRRSSTHSSTMESDGDDDDAAAGPGAGGGSGDGTPKPSGLLRLLQPDGGDLIPVPTTKPLPSLRFRGVKAQPVVFQPSTVSQVQQIVRHAVSTGSTPSDRDDGTRPGTHRRAGSTGSVSSGSSGASAGGAGVVVIDMRALREVLVIDREKCVVRVQAGIQLRQLVSVLAAHRLALPLMGVDLDHTVGGAIATGAHGSSCHLTSIPSMVLQLQLVLASGQVMLASRHRNSAAFAAALSSLGATGVITGVTLQVVRHFDVQTVEQRRPLPALLGNVTKAASSSFFYSCSFVAGQAFGTEVRGSPVLNAGATGSALAPGAVLPPPAGAVTCCSRLRAASCTGAHVRTRLAARGVTAVTMVLFLLLRGVATVALVLSPVVPALMRLWASLAQPHKRVRRMSAQEALRRFSTPPVFTVASVAVPLAQTTPALLAVAALASRPKGVHIIELQFVAADTVWLSPFFKTPCCVIRVLSPQPALLRARWQSRCRAPLTAAVEQALAPFGGRPTFASYTTLSATAPPTQRHGRLGDWLRVRSALDPRLVFCTPWLRALLAVQGGEEDDDDDDGGDDDDDDNGGSGGAQ